MRCYSNFGCIYYIFLLQIFSFKNTKRHIKINVLIVQFNMHMINIFFFSETSRSLRTPMFIFCSVVDCDVMDTKDACQVSPKGSVICPIFRNDALFTKSTQIWFQSIHSIIGPNYIFGKTSVRVLLISGFSKGNIIWRNKNKFKLLTWKIWILNCNLCR